MRVTHSQEAVEKMLKQLGATVNGRATRDNFQFSNPSHTFEMPGGKYPFLRKMLDDS